MKAFLLLLLQFPVLMSIAFAQPLQKAENLLANKSNNWSFEENRGQLADENGKVLNDIKYYGRNKGVSVYLRNNKISFVFSKTERKNKPKFSEATGTTANIFPDPLINKVDEEIKISTSRIDLEILNANPNTQILAEEKISYYTNYYLAHTPEEGITNVPHFRKITYKNIYSNIDLVLYVKEQGMKYEFVVHPKGKVSDIKLSWNGTQPDVLADGGIKYTSLLGEITESRPFTFISENREEVKSRFKVKGNVVGFEVGKYDESKMLVIDPELIWGTYYGGEGEDSGHGITTDKSNNLIITGSTKSSYNIYSNSAFQDFNPNNKQDILITKFTENGIRLWGTYYGGKENDFSRGVATDQYSNIYITGYTNSNNGIATSFGNVHQPYYEGNIDAFVVKFGQDGIRSWGTYYGGTDKEYGYSIAVDKNNFIYITGQTLSETGIATPGSHQTIRRGPNDVFIAKFKSDGNIVWGTYYGGDNSEYSYGITTDKDNYIYISGMTSSGQAIATPNAHQTFTYGFDAFITKFNGNGVQIWGTYYGGKGIEYGSSIITDNDNNVYITGYTSSENGIAPAGAFKTKLSGVSDVFAVKFNSVGIREWGTYFGGSGTEYGSALTVDKYDNIYIGAWTNSNDILTTDGAHQLHFGGGGSDVLLIKFNTLGGRVWSTYYGGSGVDDVFNITTDTLNNIYLTGRTFDMNNQKIATDSAHQQITGGEWDVFIAKFKNVLPEIDAGIISLTLPEEKLCAGTYEIGIRIKNYTELYPLDSVKIGWAVDTVMQKGFFWQKTIKPEDTSALILLGPVNFTAGSKIIKVWTFKPNGGSDKNNSNDTLIKTFFFYPSPEANTGKDTFICTGEPVGIGGESDTGNIYSWTSDPPGLISSQSKLTVSPTITTTYYLTETDTTSGCSAEDSVIITVYPFPDPVILGDTFICGQDYTTFETNTNNAGSFYKWKMEGGEIISGQGTNKIVIQIDKSKKNGKIKVTEINLGNCISERERYLIFKTSPVLNLGPDQYICETTSHLVKLDAGHEFASYLWYPTGDTTYFIVVRKVNDYYVVVTDECGNKMKDEIRIASNCPGNFHIPNAFTPNNDLQNLNETFQPKIENVVEYHLSVYNRWGERVFTTHNYNIGWDGNYNSRPAPEGIYLWMLECKVKEGTFTRNIIKKGTVHLLR